MTFEIVKIKEQHNYSCIFIILPSPLKKKY